MCPGPRRIGMYLAPVRAGARGSDGTRGRDWQAGVCPKTETWP